MINGTSQIALWTGGKNILWYPIQGKKDQPTSHISDGTSAKKSSFQLQTEETSSMVASKYRKYEKAALALSKGSFQEFPGPSLAIVSRSDGSPGAGRAGEWWSADLNASFDSEEEDMSNAQERSCVIA